MMQVWITKYALTQGIFMREVEFSSSNRTYVYTKEQYSQQFRLGTDAFETEEEAKRRAEEMRRRKIASLDKQIRKLQKIVF